MHGNFIEKLDEVSLTFLMKFLFLTKWLEIRPSEILFRIDRKLDYTFTSFTC